MIYLAANNTGCFKLRQSGFPIGMFMSPAGIRRPVRNGEAIPWALDNGLFRPFGEPEADPKECYRVVQCMARVVSDGWPHPIFVVAPDVPYSGDRSYERSRVWRPMMRDLFPEFKLALAVQDGMTTDDKGGILDGWDAVFVAGSDAWKDGTMAYWCEAARRRGLWSHVARVNDTRRLRLAIDCGADSAYGTGIWRGDKQQKRRVLDELVQQQLFAEVK